ncbi:hypothetical protein [Meiothermus sp.]
MRKIAGALFASLDSVMQAPGGLEKDPSKVLRWGLEWAHSDDMTCGAV